MRKMNSFMWMEGRARDLRFHGIALRDSRIKSAGNKLCALNVKLDE